MLIIIAVVFLTGGAAFWLAATPPSGGLIDYGGTSVTVEVTVTEEPRCDDCYTTDLLQTETVERVKERTRGIGGSL